MRVSQVTLALPPTMEIFSTGVRSSNSYSVAKTGLPLSLRQYASV